MRKKCFKLIKSLIVLSILLLPLYGCSLLRTNNIDNKEEEHVHSINNEYSYNQEGHFKTCSGCTQVFDFDEHDFTHYDRVDSTCTSVGHEAYDVCSVCGYSTYQEIAKKNHTYNVKNINNDCLRTSATCTKKATYYYSCSCGAKGTTYFESGSLASHTLTHVVGKAATCLEDGYNTYDYCTKCSYTTYQKIDKLGHSFTNYTYNNLGQYYSVCDHNGCNEIDCKDSIKLNKDTTINSNTFTSNEYTFYVSNYTSEVNQLFVLDRSSYISNKTPFYDINSIIINYSLRQANNIMNQYEYGFGNLYYIIDDYYIDNPFSFNKTESNKVTSSEVIDLTSTHEHYFSIYSNNTYAIESIIINYEEGDYNDTHKDFSITIISTNDIHGTAIDSSETAGVKKASKEIENIKSESKYNILLDQGDIYQGSIEVYLTDGYLMDDYLMLNGYDSICLGNHEWDWGEESVQKHIEYLQIPVLTNNIYKNSQLLEGLTPYKIIERHGVKIGLIGCISDCYSSISASKVKDIEFITGTALTNLIKSQSNYLRNQGCQYIILQVHGDYKEYDSVLSTGGYVDLVLEGHSHSKYATKIDGVYHIQSGGDLNCIYTTKIDFKYVDVEYVATTNKPYYYTNSAMNSLSNSTYMKEIDDYYKEYYYEAKANEVIVNNMSSTTATALDDYMAKAYYEAKELLNGTPYSGYINQVVCGGGFIKERKYDNLSGKVTYALLAEYYPFDNDICLCSISGYNLKNRFMSNQTNYHVYFKDGFTSSNVVNTKTYYIITDSYSLDYSFNGLTLVYKISDAKYPRDLLAEYLKDNFN